MQDQAHDTQRVARPRCRETIFLVIICLIFGAALFLQFYYWGLPNLWNFLACMSIITFICMAFDKKLAVNEMAYRVPNRLLLLNAVLCGGVASCVSRKVFWHKTSRDDLQESRLFSAAELAGLAGSLAALWLL